MQCVKIELILKIFSYTKYTKKIVKEVEPKFYKLTYIARAVPKMSDDMPGK